MAKTYDPKVYALAEQFMRDQETESEDVYRESCRSLASHIQDAIEDWFATLNDIQKNGPDTAVENRERRLFGKGN